VRNLLGAQLLKAGQAAAAEAVYRADLERNLDSGWSLYGLELALRAQNKHAQAAAAERDFRQVRRYTPTSS
jgi:hypothetical protein